MFCVSCGGEMEQRSAIYGHVVLYTHGCTKCDRAFHHSTPSKQTMDDRFKLAESVCSWSELKRNPAVPLALINRRRKKEQALPRMLPRCIPRFCPKCGTLLERVRERRRKNTPRSTYGCPSAKCNLAFQQVGKGYVMLKEAGKDWAGWKRGRAREERCERRYTKRRNRRA